ncbi:MAG: hypothetical protein UR27_C0006G0015 [Candidatus Peregrinibacteria bacterium GW2011_GWA2_33_10]|nr:MAG: hypothetical protein UR27_C0006G0015 [Candidatus Peregrinibacteria bacterium GW2011_GWA2_33_10]KKP39615.1 MAG: hypothetical protein UR30_C0009G0036 [Candidatus Peregrinibacteria bacterium GW2011_GWC2_33_13]OGJ50081.1 MAG: hypothetical protein A2229_01190 [Candidatus Peregrinibacteria bacterium RIFOXYA2_FULL_33_7]
MKKIIISCLLISYILIKNAICQAENLTNTVYINESMPNPKGTDKGNEWIELYNPQNYDINLKNWYFQRKNTEKTEKINKNLIIESKNYQIIHFEKLPIRNNEENLLLMDNQNKIIDEISFKNAKEGYSYNRIIEFDKNSKPILVRYSWQKIITKEKENPAIYSFEGTIQKSNFSENYFLLSTNQKIYRIHYINYIPSIAKQIFTLQNKLNIKTEKIKNHYFLTDYRILEIANPPAKKHDLKLITLFGVILLSSIFTSILIYRKQAKHHSQNFHELKQNHQKLY